MRTLNYLPLLLCFVFSSVFAKSVQTVELDFSKHFFAFDVSTIEGENQYKQLSLALNRFMTNTLKCSNVTLKIEEKTFLESTQVDFSRQKKLNAVFADCSAKHSFTKNAGSLSSPNDKNPSQEVRQVNLSAQTNEETSGITVHEIKLNSSSGTLAYFNWAINPDDRNGPLIIAQKDFLNQR